MRFLRELDAQAVSRATLEPFARRPGVDQSEPRRGWEPDLEARAERMVEPMEETALEGFARRLAERKKINSGQL